MTPSSHRHLLLPQILDTPHNPVRLRLRFSLNKKRLRDDIESQEGGRVYTDLLMPLEVLQGGEWAEVVDVTGEPAWVARLAEMGVRSGSRLRVLQPGSPCLLQLGGARLSLRSDHRLQILVRPVAIPA